MQDSPGFWILSLQWIPNSKAQDSGFLHKNSKLPDSGFGFLAWREPWASGKSTAFNYSLFLLEDEDELLESIAKSSALLQDGQKRSNYIIYAIENVFRACID